MFNLFASKRSTKIQIAKSGEQLLSLMKRAVQSRQAMLDAHGDEHSDIDLRLVMKINQVLEPLIGRSEGQGAVWFQSMDFYGDGVRHLEFHLGRFPLSAIADLQALLSGEHSPFGILCWTPMEPDVPPEQEQGIAIFSDVIVVTAKMASRMGRPTVVRATPR